MRILITGAAGFVGAHLAAQLAKTIPAASLFGLLRPGALGVLPEGMARIEADMEDATAVARALDTARPDRIVHLAAQSSPHDSWRDPIGTLRTNILGLAHLLEEVRARSLSPRVLVVGSAEEYGAVSEALQPVKEETPLRPASPYAVSKLAQGYLALQYSLSHGLAAIRTRTFNHTGPGRGEAFAESSFARQIAEIEKGAREPVIAVGNLEAVRDFTDVRDVVRAYELRAGARNARRGLQRLQRARRPDPRDPGQAARVVEGADRGAPRPRPTSARGRADARRRSGAAACGDRLGAAPDARPDARRSARVLARARRRRSGARREGVKVLLTGGTGFLGKNVARHLAAARALDLLAAEGRARARLPAHSAEGGPAPDGGLVAREGHGVAR